MKLEAKDILLNIKNICIENEHCENCPFNQGTECPFIDGYGTNPMD